MTAPAGSDSGPHDVDLLVVGGGVNGVGVARDAAGRGLSVLLCEKADLAEGTSSRSGKLVHGGLRYLEYYEFRLVRHALIEREVLLENAPHIIWPMRFVLPHNADQRPAWMVRLGLFIYDHLGGRKRLPGTRTLDLNRSPEGAPLRNRYRTGFEYSDCWCDDSRLVVLNAKSAEQKGARILTRTAFVGGRREGDRWRVEMKDGRSGAVTTVLARAIVNAAGPWVEAILNGVESAAKNKVRLVKGSHIIVPKFWKGEQAYLVQNTDKRVIFINPYEEKFALIGTTDIPYEGDAADVSCDAAEVRYLCDAVNLYFKQKLRPDDVVADFSGVRPLLDDESENPSAVTRDYVFNLSGGGAEPVLLSIFGGKITTFRKLAEQALDQLRPFFPQMTPAWTDKAPLPGGDMEGADFEAFLGRLLEAHPWLPRPLARRYAQAHGTIALRLLAGAQALADLGPSFGGGLYEREVRHLMREEWAQTADDIVLRRTKCHLHMSVAEREAFAAWMARETRAAPRVGAEPKVAA